MQEWQKKVGEHFNRMGSTIESLERVRRETDEVRPEVVLTHGELNVLTRARDQELPCPRCGLPLLGEFIVIPLADGDHYAGVRLSCSCGFVEY